MSERGFTLRLFHYTLAAFLVAHLGGAILLILAGMAIYAYIAGGLVEVVVAG